MVELVNSMLVLSCNLPFLLVLTEFFISVDWNHQGDHSKKNLLTKCKQLVCMKLMDYPTGNDYKCISHSYGCDAKPILAKK